MSLVDYFDLSPEEDDDFALWAFGEDYNEMFLGVDFMNAWNIRHSNLHKIDANSTIKNDAPIMVKHWREWIGRNDFI